MAELNPGQFKGTLFHGTTHDLQGKDFLPSSKRSAGSATWGAYTAKGQRADEHAFATTDEDRAWGFAHSAGMIARSKDRVSKIDPEVDDYLGRNAHYEEPGPPAGRVRVHTVAPHPLMRPGVHNSEHRDFGFNHLEDLHEYIAPAFRSTGTIDIQPGHQGTFPELNWNQFKHPGASYHTDLNHPTNDPPKAVQTKYVRPVVTGDQMDLLSGRTSEDHAENDESPVGDYHRNALFGHL